MPDETHDLDEILVLIDGCIELQLGDEREVRTGLTLRGIPADTRHVIRAQ